MCDVIENQQCSDHLVCLVFCCFIGIEHFEKSIMEKNDLNL